MCVYLNSNGLFTIYAHKKAFLQCVHQHFVWKLSVAVTKRITKQNV